ncbi:MAG: ABC transporter substrate-binding protein [Micrococcales bacterium]|nr:ABC transporter substrate-binding protein [Micrococcales bacterium]
MRGTARTVALASISAAALMITACGGGDSGSGNSASGSGEAKSGGAVTVRGCNPENPLVPANTNETCGGNVLDAIGARLVHYNTDTAAPEMDVAESIETSDNQNFTVKIKKGYKFSDGTEIKAKNFVDAWNWAAYGPNGNLNAYFFEPIEGYADTQSEDPDEDGPKTAPAPKAKEMSGLKVVDDSTFTIKTSTKVSNLPVRLGYTVFNPLPDSFFSDPKAFGEKPVLAGPFKVESWKKNSEIVLTKNENYSGKFGSKLDKVTFKIYQDAAAAYNDVVANNLDVTDEIPDEGLSGDTYKKDLPDRFVERDEGVFQSISFPSSKSDKSYDNPELRHAISMGIDRDTIIKQIFNGTRKPATGWVSPVVDGYKAGACGEYCTYDKAKAKAAFDKAGGYSGKLTLSYNGDSSHKGWTEAVCNSVKDALGVDCVATPVVDFSTFRAQINDRKMKGMFRTGWQMDYPSIENFLTPLYATGASSNDSDYSNPEFDKKLKDAAAETDAAKANQYYQEAEQMLAADMPVIPTWYGHRIFGFSDKVDNVKITPFGTYDFGSLTTK